MFAMKSNSSEFYIESCTDQHIFSQGSFYLQGGSTISLEIPEDANVSPPLYFVYEGSNQRHITLGHLAQGRCESTVPGKIHVHVLVLLQEAQSLI